MSLVESALTQWAVASGSACGPVIVPVFKTGGRQVFLSPVGSTPTRFRQLRATGETREFSGTLSAFTVYCVVYGSTRHRTAAHRASAGCCTVPVACPCRSRGRPTENDRP